MTDPAPRPPSIRTVIRTTLMNHLAGITPANGYTHDLTGRVHYGKPIFGAETEVPFLSLGSPPKLLPVRAMGESDGKLRRVITWELMLQGFVSDNKRDPLQPADDLLTEVELRLSEVISEESGRPTHPSIFRLANRAVKDFRIGQGVSRPPTEKVSPTAFFYLPLEIVFMHDLSKPFGE